MQYTKLFFLSTSLLVGSSMVFAMQEQEVSYAMDAMVTVIWRGRSHLVRYSTQEPVRAFINRFKKQINVPETTNVQMLIGGSEVMDENKLCGSYRSALKGGEKILAL